MVAANVIRYSPSVLPQIREGRFVRGKGLDSTLSGLSRTSAVRQLEHPHAEPKAV
jgi:hypothetical protein